MGSLNGRLRRLQKAAEGELDSFELLDGTRYYYDALTWDHIEHYFACIGKSAHDWPEPPEIVHKLTQAKDVEQAIDKVRGEGWSFLVYDEEILVNERRLEPRPLVSRYDPQTGKHVAQDPYEYEREDLSEQAQSHEDGF